MSKKTTRKKVTKKTAKKATTKKQPKGRPTGTKKRAPSKTLSKTTRDLLDKKPDLAWPWPLRDRQQKAWDALEAGKYQQILAWHRRYGKDIYGLSVARNRIRARPASYVHFLPKTVQGRRALWNGVDPATGRKFIDTAFGDMITHVNNQDMYLEFYNGATWQLLGSDNYDRFVGSSCAGVVYSEWALCDPRARDFLRPIILQSSKAGPVYELYISTFRGRNHMWQMYQELKDSPDWYVDLAGVDVTTNLDGTPVITAEDIEKERRDGISEPIIQQEYFCNPQATAEGAIYGSQVDRLRDDEMRRGQAQWDPDRPVYCVWNFDLPIFAAFTMVQPANNEKPPQVIDCGQYEFMSLGESLSKANQRRWPIHQHLIAGEQADMATALADFDIHPLVVVEPAEYLVSHYTAGFLGRMHYDRDKCELLLDALSGYVRKQRFDSSAHELTFSQESPQTWHWRLSYPLELFAIFAYSLGDEASSRRAQHNDLDDIYAIVQ